jgi:hypothetical protein
MDMIVIQNKLYRFELEYEKTDDILRRSQLKAIIEKLHGREQNNVEKFNQILNNIQNVQNKKPYHRLNLFQKEQIVKDYVERTWGKTNLEKYTKQIVQYIVDKKITTPNVVYDKETGVIENIKNITEEDNEIVIKVKTTPTEKVTTKATTKVGTKATTKVGTKVGTKVIKKVK